MIKSLCLGLSIFFCSFANASNNDTKFDTYVSGAMEVYSQFDRPSKEESEKFYSFVKSKWNKSTCTTDCTTWGVNAGKEYADKEKIDYKKPKK